MKCPLCEIYRAANEEAIDFINFLSYREDYREILDDYTKYKKKNTNSK